MCINKIRTIYISLLNEGTSVWRPVQVIELEYNLFQIPENTEVPEDEEWEFNPGTKVKCKEHTFTDGQTELIAYAKA